MALVSVIMPVFNMADTIGEQLAALSRQTYTGDWELLVCDNGCTDGTPAVCETWAGRIPVFRLIDASRRAGSSAARNCGAELARGDLFAFCDADDVVYPDWLEHCAVAGQQHDHIGGALDAFSLNAFPVPARERRALYEPPMALGFKPFAITANMVVSRRAYAEMGGFCEDLLISQDLDFSWRLQLAGYPLHFEPRAVVSKRYPVSLRAACRQASGYGEADIEIYRRFCSHGVEFPLGIRPLLSDLRNAFDFPGHLKLKLNRRTLVVALARNYGRLLGYVRRRGTRAGDRSRHS